MTRASAAGGTGLHATAIIIRDRGVLILGASGSGKSALALALMARAERAGAFGALIGDDRVFVREAHGRLIASGAANTSGIIERRTVGLMRVRHEPAGILHLAVALCGPGQLRRMPENNDCVIIAGVNLPRLALDCRLGACDQALLVEEQLAAPGANPDRIRISLEHFAAVHKNERAEIAPPARLAPEV